MNRAAQTLGRVGMFEVTSRWVAHSANACAMAVSSGWEGAFAQLVGVAVAATGFAVLRARSTACIRAE